MADTKREDSGNLRDEQTKRAVDQAERAKSERADENTSEKHRRLRREATAGRYGREGDEGEGREGEDRNIDQPGPDGTVHLMEKELLHNALTKDAPEDQEPDSRVVHIMELQMKGEAVEDYIESHPHVDAGLPAPEEPPLGGKPPEPPLGGSRSSDKRR